MRFVSREVLIAVAVTFLAGAAVFGQIPVDDVIPNRGIMPTVTYSVSDIETIDTASGNVSINIPLVSLPAGRAGHSHGIGLIYNSNIWEQKMQAMNSDPTTDWSSWLLEYTEDSGWKYTFEYKLRLELRANDSSGCFIGGNPNQVKAQRYKFLLIMPSGEAKTLLLEGYSGLEGYYEMAPDGKSSACSSVPTVSGTMHYYTDDGSFIRVDVQTISTSNLEGGFNPALQSYTIWFPNGSKVTGGGGGHQRIYDPNGNYVEVRHLLDGSNNPYEEVVDEFNRKITRKQGGSTSQDYVEATGADGQPLRWTINRAAISSGTFSYQCDTRTSVPFCTRGLTISDISSISLPASSSGNSSLSFQFQYQGQNASDGYGYGELKQITLPSGALVDYKYHNISKASGVLEYLTVNPITRKTVTHAPRYNNAPQSAEVEVWEYNVSKAYGGNATSVTEKTGSDTLGVTQFIYSQRAGFEHLVSRVVYPDGAETERWWRSNTPRGSASFWRKPNTYIFAEYSTKPNASGSPSRTAVVKNEYTKNGNVCRQTFYDFVDYSSITRSLNEPTSLGSGTVLKLREYTFYTDVPVGSFSCGGDTDAVPGDYQEAYWNLSAKPNLRTIASSSTKEGLSYKAYEQFSYDDPNTRGNVTLRRVFDSRKENVNRSHTTDLTTTNAEYYAYTYDGSNTGNLTSATDPKLNVTSYSYGSQCGTSNLYPTSATYASNSSAISRTFAYSYDCNLGMATTKYDSNNEIYTQNFYDYWGRLTEGRENGGSNRNTVPTGSARTRTAFSDADRRSFVQADAQDTSDGKYATVTHLDGLGRTRLTRTSESLSSFSTSDETTGIKVEARYRKAKIGANARSYVLSSNPFRAATASGASGESTLGWIRTESDAAGRVLTVTNYTGAGAPAPWGSNGTSSGTTTYSYNGECTTVTDQDSKSRITCVDGLGRIKSVQEDGKLTSYSYDVLDNLTQVQQSGQSRTFTYSSMSRLIQAVNPESGTVDYEYDNSGNLTKRIQRRPGQGDYSVTMSYDALDRVTSKTYTHSGTHSPNVSYAYDTATNGKGLLASVSNANSTTSITVYDKLGYPTSYSQATNGQPYAFTQQYGVSGVTTSVTYPSNRQIVYTYDLAGRLFHAYRASPTPNGYYWFGASYTPHGALASVQLTIPSRYQQTTYNARLQPETIKVGTAVGNDSLLGITYGYGSTNNNGNLRSQQIKAGSFQSTQGYQYDNRNRLCSAREMSGLVSVTPRPCGTSGVLAGGEQWYRGYGYDDFGNRWVSADDGISDHPLMPTSQGAFSAANNRLSGTNFAYDEAGRLTKYGAWDLEHDDEGRLWKLTRNVSGQQHTTEYRYDGNGRRVMRFEPGASNPVVYVYDVEGNLMAEYGGAAETAGTYFPITDHLGSTRLVLNASGGVESRHDYVPFGEEIPASVGSRATAGYEISSFLKQKFTGKERDEGVHEAGFDYFLARYYSSPLGRFATPDAPFADQSAADPQSWNLYAYVRNNPLTHIDPFGRDAVACPAGDGSCVQGYVDAGSKGAELFSGFLKAQGNALIGLANLTNALVDTVVEPLTGFRFGQIEEIPMSQTEIVGGVVGDVVLAAASAGGSYLEKSTGSLAGKGTETVQRAMSKAELQATTDTGLLRGGRDGTHYVSDAVNNSAVRAQNRLALPTTPEVKVTLEAPTGTFSSPTRVQPFKTSGGGVLPGGGMERTATGKISVKVVKVKEY